MLTEKEFGVMVQQIKSAFQKRDPDYPEVLACAYVKVASSGLTSVAQTEQLLDLLKNEMKNSPVQLSNYLRAFLGEKLKLEEEEKLKYLVLCYLGCKPKTLREKVYHYRLRWEIARLRRRVQVDGIWKEVEI